LHNKLITSAALISAVFAVSAAPMAAQARQHNNNDNRVWVCDRNVRHAANTGTVVGAVGGALLGSAIAGHGSKTGGALIGAGVGGVAGHQVAKNNAKKNCHWEYRR
jgi:uncharacterized protein YcfJ